MHSTQNYLSLTDGIASFVVEHVIPASGTLNIMGLPFSGKSFACLQLAEAVANPTRHMWMGFPVITHGAVAYAQFDTPRLTWTNRIRALQAQHMDFDHVWWLDRLDGPPAFNILTRSHAEWFRSQIEMLPEEPLVVIFDVIREVHRGPEDNSDHMQRVVDGLVRAISPAALVLISHTRKPTWAVPREQQDPDMNENRGSGYVNGRMDTVIKLTRNRLFMECRTTSKMEIPLGQLPNGLWVVTPPETPASGNQR